MLNENLQSSLDKLLLADLKRLFFELDGAPTHNVRINTD